MVTPTRRSFVRSALGVLLLGGAELGQVRGHAARGMSLTGTFANAYAPLDTLLQRFLEETAIPGMALAVARQGEIVYARGAGYADRHANHLVAPEALFRIASLSKPLTAVAIMQLVEQGKLNLDDKVLDQFRLFGAAPDAPKDPRWKAITVRQCLQHTGGWDRGVSYDPIGRPWEIARALEIDPPVGPDHVVQYMLRQPLDFDPGTRYAYSNLGYLVLGRIIENLSGMPYEQYVQRQVLAPLGITRARLGKALVSGRAEGEVTYYDRKENTGRGLYPPMVGQRVPTVYGAANLEAYEAHGGWIASAPDLVRFASALDTSATTRLLKPETVARMWELPPGAPGHDPDGTRRDVYYGLGWQVRHVGRNRINTWHTGYITGSEAILVRRWDGLTWAALINTNNDSKGQRLSGLIDGRIHAAVNAVTQWPGTTIRE